jgi:predicted transcriptional regulator
MQKPMRGQSQGLPTPGELRVLQILWRIAEGTIEDILKAADKNAVPNYKTVQTLLRIMERKGQVEHSRKGKAFVFRPRIGRGDVRRLSIREVMKNYYAMSASRPRSCRNLKA